MTFICRVKLHYGQDLMKVDFNKQQAVFRDPNGSETSKYYDFMVGCDGRRSAVRGLLEAHDPDMHHEEHVSDRSYKGFHRLPPIGITSAWRSLSISIIHKICI